MGAKKWWAICLALVIVSAGCSGDDGGDNDDSSGIGSEDAGTNPGVGVTDDAIKVGYNADLSGASSPMVTQTIEAAKVYWEWVNENGGIAGREVQPIILDNGYDALKYAENYERLSENDSEGVVMIGQSDGPPGVDGVAVAKDLVADGLAMVPLSRYSGWVDPSIGANVFEVQASYCLESINGVTFMAEQHGNTVAIISFPGEYGRDGATGAKLAATALGLEIVYDGEASVTPGADHTSIITEIVNSDPDFVWGSVDPATLSVILAGAVKQGYSGQWSGNSPTYNFELMGGGLADLLDQYYTHSSPTVMWNTSDASGMKEVVAQMAAFRPDAPVSDAYVNGWTNSMVVHQILEQAAANGDLTRAGVVVAAQEVTVDLKGLSPNQSWSGEPNENLVRESYMYDVQKSSFAGRSTVADGDAGTGFKLIEGSYSSDTAIKHDFTEACFTVED